MPAILFFVDGDITLLESGSHRRTVDFINFLTFNQIDVTVYSFRNHPTAPWTEESASRFAIVMPRAHLKVVNQTAFSKIACKLKKFALSIAPELSSNFFLNRRTSHGSWISKDFDAVIVEFTGQRLAIGRLSIPIHIDTHDLDFIKHNRRTSTYPVSAKSILKLRSEAAILNSADSVVMISHSEQILVSLLLPAVRLFVIQAFPDLDRAQSKSTLDKPPRFDLLFVGSDYQFNVDGLAFFLENEASKLAGRQLKVIGKVCNSDRIKTAAERLPNVELLGFVPDVAPYYAAASASISPVSGTGLKIKIIDSLANSCPVFASWHSMEGLPPGYDGCVFPLTGAAIDAILLNPEDLAAARSAAQAFHRRMTESEDARKFVEVLKGLGRSAAR